MKKSVLTRVVSLAFAVMLIVCMLPGAGVFADKKMVIHDITITGVTEPVAGEHPVFHAETATVDCYVNDSFDIEGRLNGVYWNEYDTNGEFVRPMTEADTFRDGYDYLIGVTVCASSGFEFGSFYANELDATVNGAVAFIWPYEDHHDVTCTFHCGFDINEIDLTVVRPKIGNTPTFARVKDDRFESKNDDPKLTNQANGVTWTNINTGVNISVNNPFREGAVYCYKVSLYPKGAYYFAPALKVFVNNVAANVTFESDHIVVSIEMVPTYKNPFVDVQEGKWYTEGVLFCNYRGYMNGVSDKAFAPASSFTRAMFVTVLSKVDGADTSSFEGSSFIDVPEGKWYSKPIQWAFLNGYSSGIGNGLFGTDDPVTREQLAVFLCNYTEKKGKEIKDRADLSGYTDADRISNWAVTGMQWAVGNGLITGMTADTLGPKGTATRAQVALIIKNYVEKF